MDAPFEEKNLINTKDDQPSPSLSPLYTLRSRASSSLDPGNGFFSASTTLIAPEAHSQNVSPNSQPRELTSQSRYYSPPITKQWLSTESYSTENHSTENTYTENTYTENTCTENPYTDLPIPVHTEFDTSPELARNNVPHNRASELPIAVSPTTVRSPSTISKPHQGNIFQKLFRKVGSRQVKPHPDAGSLPRQRLPRSVVFCFSASGKTLLLWKRNATTIISFDVLTRKASRLNLDGIIPPTDPDRRLNVRLVSAGNEWAAAVGRHRQRLHLFLIPLSVGAQSPHRHPNPLLLPLPDNFNPVRIAMSSTDGSVALSSGRHIRVYACHTGAVMAEVEIESILSSTKQQKQTPAGREEVPYQALGYCQSARRLLVATQDYSDDVEICAWNCSSQTIMDGQLNASREFLGSTRIITGYGDYRGVNTILHSTTNAITFLAGFSGKRYPNIIISPNLSLPRSSQPSGTANVGYIKSKTSQIHCAALSPSGGLVAILDGRDNVSLVDLRSSRFPLQQLGDVSHERRRAGSSEQNAVMTMLDEDHVYVYFVTDSQPVLVRFSIAGTKEVLHVGELSREAVALDC